jgi:hypothetical protein
MVGENRLLGKCPQLPVSSYHRRLEACSTSKLYVCQTRVVYVGDAARAEANFNFWADPEASREWNAMVIPTAYPYFVCLKITDESNTCYY